MRIVLATAVLALTFVACGPAATDDPAQPDTTATETDTPTSEPDGSGIGLKLDCGDTYYLDSYWDYFDDYWEMSPSARPAAAGGVPRRDCSFRWSGGSPAFDTAAIVGLYSASGEQGSPGIAADLPYHPPGQYEVSMRVEDANGAVEEVSGSIVWAWRSAPTNRGFRVRLEKPVANAEMQTGEDVQIIAVAEASGFDEPDAGMWLWKPRTGDKVVSLVNELLSGGFTAEWEFGDGTKRMVPVGGARGSFMEETGGFDLRLEETHSYDKPGGYVITVTVNDERWDRIATAKQSVTVVEPPVAIVEEPTETAPTPTSEPVPLEDGILVDIHRVTAKGEPRNGYITGEITNTNSVRVRIRSMYLELSDGTRPKSAALGFDTLEPGETTPFMEVYPTAEGEAAKTVIGVAEWQVQPAKEPLDRDLAEQIEVSDIQTSETGSAQGFQYYQVRVTLTNKSDTLVRVSARMTLRQDGEVIYIGHRGGSVDDVEPGASETLFLGTTISPEEPVTIEITPHAACRELRDGVSHPC